MLSLGSPPASFISLLTSVFRRFHPLRCAAIIGFLSTTIRVDSPGKFPHRFGAVCHEKPLQPIQDVPGPGKYNVGVQPVVTDDADNGTLLSQSRATRVERGFGSEERMEVTHKVCAFVDSSGVVSIDWCRTRGWRMATLCLG